MQRNTLVFIARVPALVHNRLVPVGIGKNLIRVQKGYPAYFRFLSHSLPFPLFRLAGNTVVKDMVH